MPTVAGSCTCSVISQSANAIPDEPLHTMVLIAISGRHTSTDVLWDGAEMTYWATGDMLAGNGIQSGYFLNKHLNGDTTFGNFEGKVTMVEFDTVIEGSWNLKMGTGKFAGITGGGKYDGRSNNPMTVQMTWTGDYNLPD